MVAQVSIGRFQTLTMRCSWLVGTSPAYC